MKQDVVLPPQSINYGERYRFLHGYQKAGDYSCLRNLTYYLALYNIRSMSKVQNWSMMEQRYTLPEFGYSSNRLVQVCIGHGVLWCRGLMTGVFELACHLPAPLDRNKKKSKYLMESRSRMALVFLPK